MQNEAIVSVIWILRAFYTTVPTGSLLPGKNTLQIGKGQQLQRQREGDSVRHTFQLGYRMCTLCITLSNRAREKRTEKYVQNNANNKVPEEHSGDYYLTLFFAGISVGFSP